MPQLYRIYSNLFCATKKILQKSNINISNYHLTPKATNKQILKNMEELSCLLKFPEFAYMRRKEIEARKKL